MEKTPASARRRWQESRTAGGFCQEVPGAGERSVHRSPAPKCSRCRPEISSDLSFKE